MGGECIKGRRGGGFEELSGLSSDGVVLGSSGAGFVRWNLRLNFFLSKNFACYGEGSYCCSVAFGRRALRYFNLPSKEL